MRLSLPHPPCPGGWAGAKESHTGKPAATAMTRRKRAPKDTRSSITVHLSASHADFMVGLLAKELEDSRREGQTDWAAAILDILESLRSAIDFEERQCLLRGQIVRDDKKAKQNRQQGGQDI